MKKVSVVLLSIMLLLVMITGCSKNPLVGKWENTAMESSYEFKGNGEGVLTFFGVELGFEYEVDEEMITMTLVGDEAELLGDDGENLTDIIPYEINDDELNIMGTVFTKAK